MDAVLEVLVLLAVVRLIVFAGGRDKPGLEHISERLNLTESVRRTSHIERFGAFMRGVDFC
ncbi:hypothetical protein [Microbulbifer marinus]|uniref:Uncharacterized protein n=1 Tax=Microbulbifer marinus TaxID=658218 RepID=A0A1H3WI27_9GAMM|nr:hypothetical protein [Microbulbifer marinus]SDZ86590.1 hypothetical protein SAMN05216562_0863 [Microbulbifer marinus]